MGQEIPYLMVDAKVDIHYVPMETVIRRMREYLRDRKKEGWKSVKVSAFNMPVFIHLRKGDDDGDKTSEEVDAHAMGTAVPAGRTEKGRGGAQKAAGRAGGKRTSARSRRLQRTTSGCRACSWELRTRTRSPWKSS